MFTTGNIGTRWICSRSSDRASHPLPDVIVYGSGTFVCNLPSYEHDYTTSTGWLALEIVSYGEKDG